jgi:hypothetical protein
MKKIARVLIGLFLSLLFVGCASVPRPAVNVGTATAPPYEAWARVLDKYVDDQGRVNFKGIAADRADLDQFVAYIYDIAPNNKPQLFATPAHVLAFHINAYNALAMHKVVQTGIPVTLSGIRKVGFFYLGKVQVGGTLISLYDYENKVIRPLGETRIHVALNCMSVGCPRLPREVFSAEKLETQLDREAKMFFNDVRNVQVNDVTKTLKVSEILKFYTPDFLAKAASLTEYVNRYRDVKVPENYTVEFIDYDWTINRAP